MNTPQPATPSERELLAEIGNMIFLGVSVDSYLASQPVKTRQAVGDAIRSALPNAEVVVAWQTVPKEPTPDMRIAGGIAWSAAIPESETNIDCADACYKAMLAASPPAARVDVREALNSMQEWCEIEGNKLGAVDGYDYISGVEFGLRKASIELKRRALSHSPAPDEVVKALEPFAKISLVRDQDANGPDMIDAPDLAITPNDVRRARAALQRTKP